MFSVETIHFEGEPAKFRLFKLRSIWESNLKNISLIKETDDEGLVQTFLGVQIVVTLRIPTLKLTSSQRYNGCVFAHFWHLKPSKLKAFISSAGNAKWILAANNFSRNFCCVRWRFVLLHSRRAVSLAQPAGCISVSTTLNM